MDAGGIDRSCISKGERKSGTVDRTKMIDQATGNVLWTEVTLPDGRVLHETYHKGAGAQRVAEKVEVMQHELPGGAVDLDISAIPLRGAMISSGQ